MKNKISLFLVSLWFGIQIFAQSESSDHTEGSLILKNAVSFTSSNLPIFVINVDSDIEELDIPSGQPKKTGRLGIIYNGQGQRNNIKDNPNHYDGFIGIELHGNSTRGFPKKPFRIETRNSLGENRNVSLLGMPSENDWVLRSSYLDHTFIRNPIAMHMSRLTGRWASRCRLVELVFNDEYMGIYVLMEKIKRDKGRLDIAKLNPDEVIFPDIAGGYIYEITGFKNNIGQSRYLRYPKYDEAAPEQINYIRQFDDSFRDVMNSPHYDDESEGYAAWIDVNSFVDELIVQEAVRNSDAYGWSAYFHKDKDSRIIAGPVWDFDQSAGNSSYPDDGVVTGWMFSHPSTNNTPFFWEKLFEDPVFAYKVRHRWEELRNRVYKTSRLVAYIDSIADMLSEAQEREFDKWPVLGQFVWRETSGYEFRYTYYDEVNYLKNFLIKRWAWMDLELGKIENPASTFALRDSALNDLIVYPNPVNDHVVFELNSHNTATAKVLIYSVTGAKLQPAVVFELVPGNNTLMLSLTRLKKPGIYLYKILIDYEPAYTGRLVKVNDL